MSISTLSLGIASKSEFARAQIIRSLKRVLARERHIEQNLTLNVDLDFMTRDRFKIILYASTDHKQSEKRVLARKRHIEKNLT